MPRRTIQDLVARYTLEPTLRDVYVEGRFDQRVLRLFFKEAKCDRPSINIVDFVHIPDEILTKYQATRGEKTELLALASEVYSLLGNTQGFTAVVDADFDRLLEKQYDNPLVFLTDFTCMEMYWIEESNVRRFFTWIGEEGRDHDCLIGDIGPTATDLFLMRGAIISLDLRAPLIPIRRHCEKVDCRMSLDANRYGRFVLMSAGNPGRHDELIDEIARLRPRIDQDQRHSTNGHDLAELIFLAYRERLRPLGLIDSRSVETTICMTMPIHLLAEHSLFQNLLQRAY
jgi:hypothetical protein